MVNIRYVKDVVFEDHFYIIFTESLECSLCSLSKKQFFNGIFECSKYYLGENIKIIFSSDPSITLKIKINEKATSDYFKDNDD